MDIPLAEQERLRKTRGSEGLGEASHTNPAGMALVQTLHCLSVNPGEAAGGAETHDSSRPFTCQSFLTNMITYSLSHPPLWIILDLKWAKCTLHLKSTETHTRTHTHIQGSSASPCCAIPFKARGDSHEPKMLILHKKHWAEGKVIHNRTRKCMPSWLSL